MLGLEMSPEEGLTLLKTMEMFNAACNAIAGEEGRREQVDLPQESLPQAEG